MQNILSLCKCAGENGRNTEMKNRTYSKRLVQIICLNMGLLTVMQAFISVYISEQQTIWPRVLTWVAFLVEIITFGILIASLRLNQDVGKMVYTDVTGIKNKLAYQTQLNRLNEERDTFAVGVIMFDLNNLKQVNDTHGHEMGDSYIEAFSSLLSYLQNDRISAYRVGGDEFAMILEQTNAVEIHHILDKLEVMVKEYNAKHALQISYARGYEISTSEHYYLMEELTKRADNRMYTNKRKMKEHRKDREQIS